MEAELPAVVILTDLSTDMLALILLQLALSRRGGRAREIARTAAVNKPFRDAAKEAVKARRRVCYEGHTEGVWCVAAAPDGHVITGSDDMTVKVLSLIHI